MSAKAAEARYFESSAAFRGWLAKHHTTESELLVGYFKRHTQKPSMTWSESVDEALCFGWIDGVRRRVDDESYVIRFTPRRPGSIWSAVNQRKMAQLEKEGRLTKAGVAAYAKKSESRSAVYSFEQPAAELSAEQLRELRRNKAAHADFDARAPWYKKAATWWIISAKQDATKQRRLGMLIEHHARGETIPSLTRK